MYFRVEKGTIPASNHGFPTSFILVPIKPVFGCLIFIGLGAYAQDTISTVPTFINNNGQSGVSFEIEATAAIKVIGIANYFNSGVTSTTIWIRTGGLGITSGPLSVTAANGWSQHQISATVAGNGSSPVYVQNLTPILIPANGKVGIVIQGGLSYYTVPSTAPTTFTNGVATLNAGGALTGFGGTVPSLGFNPRDWNYFRNFIRVAILWTRKFH